MSESTGPKPEEPAGPDPEAAEVAEPAGSVPAADGRPATGSQPVVPPKPPLPPAKLQRELAAAARREAAQARREAIQARREAVQARREEKERQRAAEEERRLAERPHAFGHVGPVNSTDLATAFGDQSKDAQLTRRRYRRVHGIILGVLALLLVLALTGALLISQGVIKLPQSASASSSAPADPNCPTTVLNYPENITVSVNVYNASQVPGLAGTLANELRSRGFQVGTVGNKEIASTKTGVIVAGTGGLAAAFNLQRNLPGLEFRHDDRADATVDVYLLQTFKVPTAGTAVDKSPGTISCTAGVK
ncbi:LytR C-terminal domain-containing protein [Psychromicrobium xiongbiense]|uniref:LytR C-terminal domain-containing protein n=1 Tax=Psychromicrobium xiongbiense TaxID=3051184 RepID=UPI002555FE43|nr:LytR C-terminal domain-containing protein [Psychromicrobium sp. YIM S02556]